MREMHAIFGPEGLLSKAMDGFTYRKDQEEIASLVSRAFKEDAFAVIEAGTGIGKSFAYLVPSMEFAGATRTKLKDHERQRTVISTGTLNLMTQLYDKDVALLETRMGYTARVAMLCGRGNYLCIRRWKELFEVRDTLKPAQRQALESVGDEVREDGFSGLRFRLEEKVSDALWSAIRAEKDFCPAGSCPYIDECFFYKAKAEARKADLIITNHSLLFSDARIKRDVRQQKEQGTDLVLPPFHHLVIDEAHGISDIAARFYAMSYNPLVLERLLRHLAKNERGHEGLLAQISAFCRKSSDIRHLTELIGTLGELMRTVNETLLAHIGPQETAGQGEIPIASKADLPDSLWKMLSEVQQQVSDLAGALSHLVKEVTAPKSVDEVLGEIDAIADHIGRMAEGLEELPKRGDEFIRCMQVVSGLRNRWVVLEMVPFSVSGQLREDLFDQMDSIVFTSATLSTTRSGDFSYWMQRCGLEGYQKRALVGDRPFSFPSPFDFAHRMLIMTVRPDGGAPLWQAADHKSYDKMVAETVLSLIEAAEGGVLVLLASYGDLYALLGALAVAVPGKKDAYRVKGSRRTLLFQGQAPRGKLTDRFIEEEDSVLLGTHSFWEGVDVPGKALSMVIIPRIPFRNVRDPFMVKVDELARKREQEVMKDPSLSDSQKRSILWKESPFVGYQMPYATLLLRQGIGRLIRSGNDRGVVALLDVRLARLGYGKTMQKAFPTKVEEVPASQMGNRAAAFYGAGK